MPETATRTYWYTRLFETIDAKDADGFAAHITDDGRFRYGSSPAVEGRRGIRDFVEQFLGSVEGTKHTLERTWETPDTRFVAGDVTYYLGDGREVTVPFLNRFEMDGELIRDYLIYIDPSPLAG